MVEDAKKPYWIDVLDALNLESPNARQEILEVVAGLVSAWKREPTSENAYAIGYAMFHMPVSSAKDASLTVYWLIKAASIDSTNFFAIYFLGAHFFELHLVDIAREYLASIPTQWFSARGQEWRDHKVSELLLCCQILDDPSSIERGMISSVMALHQNTASDEVWPLPEELVSSVCSVTQERRENSVELAYWLADELRAARLEKVFVEEMKVLEVGRLGDHG